MCRARQPFTRLLEQTAFYTTIRADILLHKYYSQTDFYTTIKADSLLHNY